MADKKKMSVEEMLAACRTADSGSDSGAKSTDAPKAEAPKAKQAPSNKKPGEMSVADMLAAARSEKAAGGSEAATEKKPAAKAKPTPAKAAKPTTKKELPTAGGPKDTQSILAAARNASKPGPISKTEAAAKGVPVEKKKAPAPVMPAKPDYAKPRAVAAQKDRRFFLGVFFGSFLSIGFTSLGFTHALWGLGFARFMFPNILTEPPTKFKVGSPGDLAPGTVETKYKAQFGVWIVRDQYNGQPQIFALKSVCTHLGCTPNWLEAEQKFKCPCHGSGFYKDGINFEGPAPRPLERYAIQTGSDGQLEVDKSKKFQEEMGQWNDTASFVPV